jgi:hypothetical protein
MQQVDQQLQAETVPIPARPMRAESILAVALKERFVRPCPKREPVDGRYTGDDLTIRVSRWFTARYGDRLKIHFGPGRMAIMIRGDPWVVRFPMLTGTWDLFLSATEPSEPGGRVSRLGDALPPLRYNIVESIADFPPGLVTQLAGGEARRIISTWRDGFEGLHAIGAVSRRHHLVPLALADWETTVDQLTTRQGNVGLARWHSLQTVEKMLKAYVALRDATYKWSHDLTKLADDAEGLGLAPIDRSRLGQVQCTPGVRYDTESITMAGAVQAHHASLGVSVQVAKAVALLPTSSNKL